MKSIPYNTLSDLIIPPNQELRQINGLVDFFFGTQELKDEYCFDNNRNAIPILFICSNTFLNCIYPLSDADWVERSRYDLSYSFFLDYTQEEAVIDCSSLTYFR